MSLKFRILSSLLFVFFKASANDCGCEPLKKDPSLSPGLLIGMPEKPCRAEASLQLASFHLKQKNFDSAKWYLQNTGRLYKELNCPESDWLTAYELWSSLHFQQAEYQQALDFSFKALPLLRQTGNREKEADVLLGISQIFGRMGQTGKGIEYARNSVPLIMKLTATAGKTDLLNKAGSRYYFFFQDNKDKSLLDSATFFFQSALQTARSLRYTRGMQTSYNKMNSLAYQQKDYALALRYIDSSIALSIPGEVSNTLATSYGDKGNILLKLGRFREAAVWADSCLYYYKKIGFPPLIANASSLVAEIADSLCDYPKAYQALYFEKKITDSLNTAEKASAVAEVEKKYNQARNEKTIRELHQQKQIYLLMAAAGLLLAGVIAFFFRQQSLRQKQKILETEQRLNRARMNPHFFFNALTAMQRFAMKENNGMALASSLSKFSHIMRETLESTYKDYVTVKQEMEFLREYLEIQKLRFPELFSYALMVDGEMDKEEVLIPSMILQPFIENSIEHGFAGIGYPGEIRVDFRLQGREVLVEIRDNGKGLPEPGARASEHISRASQIIRDRIYLLNIKLKCKAAFSIDNQKNGPGVQVTIRLPLIFTNENTAG